METWEFNSHMTTKKLITIGLSSILLTSVTLAQGEGKKRNFEELDTNSDSKISEAEFLVDAKSEKKAKERFKKKDKDADGFLSKVEFDTKVKKKGPKKKGPKKPKKAEPKEEGAE